MHFGGFKQAIFLLILWVFLLPIIGFSAPQQSTPQDSAEPEAEQGEDQYSFSVDIEVVTVPVTVTDRSGEFITDLDKNEFRIQDNGSVQQISNFELSWEPISLAIVVQTSSRIQSLLPDIRSSGILFTQLLLGESGEAAVVTFDNEVQIAQEFTDNPEKIEKALQQLRSGGDSAKLSDALARAIFLLQRRPVGRRKVIVVISESRDIGSSSPIGLVLRGAQQLGISIYTLGLSSFRALLGRSSDKPSSPIPPGVMARPMPSHQPPTPDAQTGWGAASVNVLDLMQELVSIAGSLFMGNPLDLYSVGTGGNSFSPDGAGKLEESIAQIGRELHNQYLLTYRPNNLGDPGFHTINVSVASSSLKVRHRPGYMFTKPLAQKTSKPEQSSGETISTAPSP
ncbi:MAG: hypothetical protein A3F68_00305 [Acidobacteria bacterium RIFCSPLOWO2_12_FULL_54_10]|nr:MAG: hypothetical protein A3F68_00305 [Acidobacteria bacterium RIFCSPLOWO2_12_FULL_54_10]